MTTFPKWQTDIVAEYPELLKEYGGDKTKTCLAFGFAIRIGWKTILESLLEDLQAYNDKHTNQQVRLTEVKEKFGMLRIGIAPYFDRAIDIVSMYENLSKTVCESCGMHGSLRTDRSWIKTLCDDCNGK